MPQRGQRTHLKVDSGSVVIGVFHSGFIAGSSSLGPHSQRYVKATVASDSSRERFSHSSCFFSTPVLPQNSLSFIKLLYFLATRQAASLPYFVWEVKTGHTVPYKNLKNKSPDINDRSSISVGKCPFPMKPF